MLIKHLSSLMITVAVASPTAVAGEHAERVIDAISPDSLRGHLSFIASDLLGGRATPSPGLEIASEYIAAQFRRAGVEPLGDDEFFQTTTVQHEAAETMEFSCTVRAGDDAAVSIERTAMTAMVRPGDVLTLDSATAAFVPFPLAEDGSTAMPEVDVIVTDMPAWTAVPREEMQAYFQKFTAFRDAAAAVGATCMLLLDPSVEEGSSIRQRGRMSTRGGFPIFVLHGAEVHQFATSREGLKVDLHFKRPEQVDVPVRNVIGVVRGSDPVLRDEYIIVSAHYDHVGIGAAVDGDDIYNGANDDGSGTVTVIELASAFGQLPAEERPKRSIIFICLFGEESGLLGSRHYVEHPVVPLQDTIANINLEHLGRTDDTEGDTTGRIMPTGFDYSTAIDPFVEAGERHGIEVFHHPRNSASFFGRSDNVAFANAGIPAHTFCAAFIFPDYHGAGDHWERINYENMAGIARVVADGLVHLANADERPRWNEAAGRIERYLEAWRELHGEEE